MPDVPDVESTSEREIVDLRGHGPFVSLGRYHYLAAHEPMPEQCHQDWLVLALPLRSRVDFVLDDRVLGVDPRQAVLIRPGTRYRVGSRAQPRGDLLWLILDVVDAGPALTRVIDELRRCERDVLPVSAFAVDLLNRALAADDRGDWSIGAWRESLCTTALIDLIREPGAGGPEHNPGLRRALRWLDDHLEEQVTAARLVEVSGMSASRFYETFTEAFGTSPKDHVLRAKIDRSALLLTETSDTVTAIAHRLGFSSSQYFASAFRRYVGMSPTEYRNRTP